MPQTALLASRAVLRIAGPDASSFLQGIVTRNVEALAPGGAAFAALLTPQGKILFDFILLAADGGFLLDCDKASAEALTKRLSLYRLRAKVTIEPAEDLAVGAGWDGACSERPGRLHAFDDPRLPALGLRMIGPRAAVAEATGEGAESFYDGRRIGLGVPAQGRDFGAEEVFLTDVNYDALNAVDYKKGCFVGQEVTSRMKRKGEIRKRTVMLSFGGPPPAKGTPVMAGDTAVGEVLSGVAGMALALARLDRLAAGRDAGSSLTVEGRAVRIEVPGWLEQR